MIQNTKMQTQTIEVFALKKKKKLSTLKSNIESKSVFLPPKVNSRLLHPSSHSLVSKIGTEMTTVINLLKFTFGIEST